MSSPRLLARRALSAAGLLPLAFSAYRSLREWSPALAMRNARIRRTAGSLPVPPGGLVFSVAGSRDLRWFLDSGAATAAGIETALADAGHPIATLDPVLDFGCGCGRVLRHWHGRDIGRLHGCDYNPAGIAWVRRHLPHARVAVNGLAPPLPYSDGQFGLVYAMSVFTHFPEALQHAWLHELHRVLHPGGVLLFTTMGSAYLPRLSEAERARFAAGALVVRDAGYAGSNVCAAYHPPEWVRHWIDGRFIPLLSRTDGIRGMPGHDVHVIQRT